MIDKYFRRWSVKRYSDGIFGDIYWQATPVGVSLKEIGYICTTWQDAFDLAFAHAREEFILSDKIEGPVR